MGAAELLVLALLGGVLALDGTSLGQFMVSRPLVACTLAGWAAGSPGLGAVIGVVMEALHVAVLPVGAARYPEGAPAGVAAAAVFARGGGGEALLLAAVLFALAWEWVGSLSVHHLRNFNVRLAAADGSPVAPGTLERRHLAALALDFARGALVTAAGLLLLDALAMRMPAEFPVGWGRLAAGLAAAAAVASSIRLFGKGRLAWFAAGAAAGTVFLLAR